MKVKDIKTGEEKEALIKKVTSKELKAILKDKDRFEFDWANHGGQELYKLISKEDKKMLGLIAITDHTDEAFDAIEINLLEVGKENVGKGKVIDKIAGCMIAFACRESFKRNHKGVVFLIPKSGLVDHYTEKYGFGHFPWRTLERPEGFMLLENPGSLNLIKSYY